MMAHQGEQFFTPGEGFPDFSVSQDVVPVNDDALPNWKYSPFSGHYDGPQCDLR